MAAGAVGLGATALFAPPELAGIYLLLAVIAILGGAFLLLLKVARFHETAMEIGKKRYRYDEIAEVSVSSDVVFVPRRSGGYQRAVQEQLVLTMLDANTPPVVVPVMNARGGASLLAELLRARLPLSGGGDDGIKAD